MLPESIETLHRLLKENGIEVLLAGGWAVNAHGYGRQTNDVDWVACDEQEEQIQDLMTSLRFIPGSTSNLVTRFSSGALTMPTIDFLWVDRSTFSKLNTGDSFSGRDGTVPLLRLDHLIAMKIHALKSHEERQGRDLLDIRFLLEANPRVISDLELRDLCSLHGPLNAYHLITES
jgi:hypothetical protein